MPGGFLEEAASQLNSAEWLSCEEEQTEKQAAQGPHVENLTDVWPKHGEKDNPAALSSRPRAPVAGRSLG